jgi:hypothetical protein
MRLSSAVSSSVSRTPPRPTGAIFKPWQCERHASQRDLIVLKTEIEVIEIEGLAVASVDLLMPVPRWASPPPGWRGWSRDVHLHGRPVQQLGEQH